jgi:hypothetical protein
MKMGADAAEHGAQKFRGNDRDHDLGIGRSCAVAGYQEAGGEGKSGKELRVFTGVGDLLR